MKNNIINMKNKMERMKVGLVALLLIIGVNVSAQISPSTQALLRGPLSGEGTETIFAHGSAEFKLTASLISSDDGGVEGVTFDEIKWYFEKADGGLGDLPELDLVDEPVVGGVSNSELTVTGLKPGFYTFIAVGETEDGICSVEPEEFTVFVLQPLKVTVSHDLASLNYCSDDVPADDNSLTATAVFDDDVEVNAQSPYTVFIPDLEDFELRYRWYKVADGTAFDIGTATLLATHTVVSEQDIYTLVDPEDAAVGEWNYYVAVDYTVKESGPYTNALGGDNPTVIKVTPKPGKPIITIGAL